MSYAGFWLRFAACLIDGILLSIVFLILYLLLGDAAGLLLGIVGWLYYALMESSDKQATFGKLALGLRVTNTEGDRIGFGKATGRYFGKIISQFILYIGYFMAGFTSRKQGLHDMMAGCLVVRGAGEGAAYGGTSSTRKHHRAFDFDNAFDNGNSGGGDSGGGDSGGGGRD